jgi:hypothetical protein
MFTRPVRRRAVTSATFAEGFPARYWRVGMIHPSGVLGQSVSSERVARMSEFQQEIEIRLETATRSLAEAERDGDDYLAQVRLGEIESLRRLAQEHGAVA